MWRWMGILLALFAFATGAGVVLGQAPERSNLREVLTAASLTQTDLPRGLALDRGRSGARTSDDGWPSYTAIFVADGTGDASIMGVVNAVSQYPDAATGIDRHADRYRSGLGGNRSELPAPALGEESRAFTVTTPVLGGLTASTAFVAIRRADIVASVAVASLGDSPQMDVALRLAEAVDRRLAAALGSGA